MSKKTSDLSPGFEKSIACVMETAKSELQAAAKAHGVRIRLNEMVYATLAKTTVVHVPIEGIEKYKEADFEVGAPIQLLLVKSATRGDIPSGSYVVKVQHRRRATSGKAFFTDRTGTVVAQRKLIIRTWKESAVLFPDVYSDPGPQLIPNITSTHIWRNNRWMVDCAGWIPYRVLYY
jgi:hypothetical protein